MAWGSSAIGSLAKKAGRRFCRPGGSVLAAGDPERPEVLRGGGRAGAQVIGVEFVEARAPEPALAGGAGGGELLSAELSQDGTDQRRGETMRALAFFIRREQRQPDGLGV